MGKHYYSSADFTLFLSSEDYLADVPSVGTAETLSCWGRHDVNLRHAFLQSVAKSPVALSVPLLMVFNGASHDEIVVAALL